MTTSGQAASVPDYQSLMLSLLRGPGHPARPLDELNRLT